LKRVSSVSTSPLTRTRYTPFFARVGSAITASPTGAPRLENVADREPSLALAPFERDRELIAGLLDQHRKRGGLPPAHDRRVDHRGDQSRRLLQVIWGDRRRDRPCGAGATTP